MFLSKTEYKLREDDREFADLLPPLSILIAGIIFLVGTTVAILLYKTPNGGYNFFEQYFSELGLRFNYTTTDGEFRYATEHPDIFNYTLYASGFLMIWFFLFSYRQMRNARRISRFFLFLSTISGMVAGPFLIGVGVFDLGNPGLNFWEMHGFWTGLLYLLLTTTSIFWYLMLLTSKNLPYRHNTRWIWLDYLFLIALSFFTILNLVDGIGLMKIVDTPYVNIFSVETYQKFIAYVFFMYYGLVVGIRLSKTKYDNTPIKVGKTAHAEKVGDDSIWYCTNCGEENPNDTKFCIECGVRLD